MKMTVKRKGSALKRALAKALRQNRRLPVFVVARTRRRLRANPRQRSWKRKKLDVKAQKRTFRSRAG
jgi:large subunit ribosomal protein L39e